MAAVLACGDGAVLSHRSAAELWGMLQVSAAAGSGGRRIDVALPRDGGRRTALCRDHRIPTPEVNVIVGKREVDFVWRRLRVTVETDGYGFHRGQYAFEDDHERDLALRALGYDVVRLTYRQLTTKPSHCMAIVKKALNSV